MVASLARPALAALLAVAAALSGAGCATDAGQSSIVPQSSAAPTSVASGQVFTSVAELVKTAQPGDVVEIHSTLVTKDGVPYLCDWTMESDPMQPGDPKIAVSGVPLDKLSLDERRGVLSGSVALVIRMTSTTTADFMHVVG